MERLTPLLRRVLGSLPVWHEDEASVIAHENEEHGLSVRSHNLDEMHKEMFLNPHAQVADDDADSTRPMTRDEVRRCLDWCVENGYASAEVKVPPLVADGETVTPVEHWKMTQEGFEEIHRPEAPPENVVPGPVKIEVDPAVQDVSASMGVQADA